MSENPAKPVEASMARTVDPEPLGREDVPLTVKLAAVKAYIAVAGSCQPAAMHAALQAALAHYLVAPSDPRPSNCRFRLQDEGKAYPRSSCAACGASVMKGLGRQCGVYQPTTAFVDGPAPTPRKF